MFWADAGLIGQTAFFRQASTEIILRATGTPVGNDESDLGNSVSYHLRFDGTPAVFGIARSVHPYTFA